MYKLHETYCSFNIMVNFLAFGSTSGMEQFCTDQLPQLILEKPFFGKFCLHVMSL